MAGLQIVEPEAGDSDSLQFDDGVSQGSCHFSDHAVFALRNDDCIPGVGVRFFEKANILHPVKLTVNTNPRKHTFLLLDGEFPGELDKVFLLNAIARVHDEVGEVSVISEEHKAFRVIVEPPNGKERNLYVNNKVAREFTTSGVRKVGEISGRLIKRNISKTRRGLNTDAVESDNVGFRVYTVRKVGDRNTIHFDSARGEKGGRTSPGSNARA